MSGSVQPAFVRVVNGQVLPRSILLDKIDRSSGQFVDGVTYAEEPKQKVYVPYKNPLDLTVAGYVDLYPSDEVLLQMKLPKGVIAELAKKGYVSFFSHSGALVAAPAVTASVHGAATGASGVNGVWSLAGGGVAVFTDATASAFLVTDPGKFVTVSGSIHPATNNGTFLVTAYGSATHDTLQNPNAVVDTAVDVWSMSTGTTITGTTFLSLTPDHTYVFLTNNSTGAKQTLTDTAIIAAEGSVGATSIVIPDTIITIGSPAAGWLVQIQANSKKSNVFTMT